MVSEQAPARARLACMALLGVDVHVCRRPLPQALPSRITRAEPAVAEPAAATANRAQRPEVVGHGARARQRMPAPSSSAANVALALLGDTAAAKAPPPAELPPQPASSPASTVSHTPAKAVAFNLLTVAFPAGIVFVSDIRQAPLGPALESAVLAFLHDIMLAVGRPVPDGEVHAQYVQWPLVRRPGVDASEVAARDVLAALVARKLREVQAEGLVLMGRAANTYVTGGDLPGTGEAGLHVVTSEALGKLFAEPSLKAKLWQALQPLVVVAN